MQINEIIKNLMVEKHLNQVEIAPMVNMKSQAGVSQALSRDMKTSMLLRFLEVMDCDLIVRNQVTGEEYTVTK